MRDAKVRLFILVLAVGLALSRSAESDAQTPTSQAPPSASFTLDQAMQYALDHYPTVRAALEQLNAATADVSIARGAYLPRLDSIWQSNRATANNVFGQLLPQSVIPSLSGPVLPSTSDTSVWGSAGGALFSWEPFDFGLRHAEVALADAGVTHATASTALTRLDVQSAVANAFLAVVAAQRAAAAAQADFDRRNVLHTAVQTLVDNQLRPGADASRATADRAAAQTRLIQARQTVAIARTTLARLLGVTTGAVQIAGDTLMSRMPPDRLDPAAPAAVHPLLQIHRAAVDEARAAEGVLARSDFPRVYVQSSVSARGSGADPSGTFDGTGDGLGLDRVNWAAGVQLVLPNVFDFATLHARKAAAAADTRAQAALYDEARLTIAGEQQEAMATLDAARAVAANTPVQLAAAQQSERQARARYDAGLASLVEVADAQSLLAQAEAQDQVARVAVWRALLAVAVAQGDVGPFITAIRQP
jgi:outer membrane protein TolC